MCTPSVCAWLPSQAAGGLAAPQILSPTPSEDSEGAIREYARQGRWKDVTRLAQDLVDKDPTNSTGWYWLGVTRFEDKESIGAVQAFRTAERRGLDTPELHKGLAVSYYGLNQFFLFEQEMYLAAKLNPSDGEPYFYLGSYRELVTGDFAGALGYFSRAVQIKPDDAQFVYHKGYCLDRLGRWKEARECYLEAIHLRETQGSHFGWPYQGMARLCLDNPQEGLSWAERAVEIEPGESSNHLVLASLLQKLGVRVRAIREAQEAVKLNPANSKAHYLLFKLYREAGDAKAAQAELEMFEKLNAVYGLE